MGYKEDKLFEFIKKRIPKSASFVEEISEVLDISYDAAYRRINSKTTLSFEEAMILTDHYQIPIYDLYDSFKDRALFVSKNNFVNSYESLEDFYNNISEFINLFSKFENPDLLYAAKDLSIYYLPEESVFAKFKLFVSLNILTEYKNKGFTTFKNFYPKLSMLEATANFRKSIKKIKVTEIWNDTTINSSLYQIYYFYEIRLITKEEALLLCNELEEIITNIELTAASEIWNKDRDLKYELYYNRIINLNNTVYLRSKTMNSLLVPYASLSHIKIEDEKTCREIEVFFKKQLKYSKMLSGNSEVARRTFFNTTLDKIEQIKLQIKTKSSLSFI